MWSNMWHLQAKFVFFCAGLIKSSSRVNETRKQQTAKRCTQRNVQVKTWFQKDRPSRQTTKLPFHFISSALSDSFPGFIISLWKKTFATPREKNEIRKVSLTAQEIFQAKCAVLSLGYEAEYSGINLPAHWLILEDSCRLPRSSWMPIHFYNCLQTPLSEY
jgi:hypothetical protein